MTAKSRRVPTASRSTGQRFVLVGLGGFAVQSALLAGLTRLTPMDYRVATLLAVEAAVLHNFIWHDRWTWPRTAPREGRWQRALRFHLATALVSVAGNVALMALFVGGFGWPVLAANAAAVLLLAIVNFRAADGWVFKASPGRAHHAATRPIGAAVAFCGLLAAAGPAAAGPTPDAAAAWAQYVARTEHRITRELRDGQRFLSSDFDQARRDGVRRRVLGGEVVITGDSVDVPDGLIHHWHGYVFIPGGSLDALMASIADPTGPRAIRQEDVLDARVLSRTGDGMRLYLKLQRQQIVSVAYNTEHDVRFRRHANERASSRSTATRIAELEDAGLPSERERPDADDRGFLWRMNAYWRYEAVPGGVIVELESLTLSRGLPWGMRTVVRPLVERVARESIARTLVTLGERARDLPAGPAARTEAPVVSERGPGHLTHRARAGAS